jgi:hypothetical protein
MPVEFIETQVADNTDVGDKRVSIAVSSSEKSPVGYESDIVVYLTFFSEERNDEDEALWDKQFAQSQDLIDRLADEALADHRAGLTEEFDPDNDPDVL